MAETATEVREQAQEKAQEAKAKASDQARTQIDQRSTDLGEKVHSTAGDIRTVGQQLSAGRKRHVLVHVQPMAAE